MKMLSIRSLLAAGLVSAAMPSPARPIVEDGANAATVSGAVAVDAGTPQADKREPASADTHLVSLAGPTRSAVPEPHTYAMLLAGVVAVAVLARLRKP